MKQKIVIKVRKCCEKSRTEAMRLVASAYGLNSIEVTGDDKDQLALVGDCIDPVYLTSRLRNKVGYAELVRVEVVKEEKLKVVEEVKPKDPQPLPPLQWYPCHHHYPRPVVFYEEPSPNCSIM